MEDKNQELFTLHSLEYSYPNSHFSLNLNGRYFKKGQVVAFIGANGCGKSTLYKSLSGVVKPSKFDISVGEKHFKSLVDSPLAIGFHNAFAELNDRLTVKDNVEFNSLINGVNNFEEAIDRYAGILNIRELINKYPRQLSAGQKHRSKLLRTLIHDPDIILLDEPTTASDIKNIELIMQMVQHLIELGKTVFISTHHIYELSLLKPRLIGIKKGEAVFDWDWQDEFDSASALRKIMMELIPNE